MIINAVIIFQANKTPFINQSWKFLVYDVFLFINIFLIKTLLIYYIFFHKSILETLLVKRHKTTIRFNNFLPIPEKNVKQIA